MDWRDIACIVFVCTTANHLGLVKAAERVIRHGLPILNCPKCMTFWATLAYTLVSSACHADGIIPLLRGGIEGVALSLLCSYLAIWLELFMYAIDTLYNKLYGKIEEYNEKDGRESY